MKLKRSKPAPTGRQRRQTTDWQKPAAFSYHNQRAERPEATGRQQSNLAAKRRQLLSLQFWAKRSGLLVVGLVALVSVVVLLGVSTTPRIVLQRDGGGSQAFHTPAVYQAAASQYLTSSIWNRNKVTVNSGAAGADLQRRYPELGSVVVTVPLAGHKPVYYLRANAPAFVLQAINGNYVLDASGKVLLPQAAAKESEVAPLPTITDQTGLHAEIGKQAISSQQAAFIRTVVATLAAKQHSITNLLLPQGGAQELQAHVDTSNYVVKFNMHDAATARQQVGTYLATLANLSAQKITPAQYIDVRVPGRAYYQ